MAQITRKNVFAAGTPILSAQVNEDFNDIYAEFNGSISNANIDPAAAIVDTRLAQITTPLKVSAVAITELGQITEEVFALTPGANIATVANTGSVFTVTLDQSSTLDSPSTSANGMKKVWRIRQDGTGNFTLTLGSSFRIPTDFGATGQLLPIALAANATTYVGAMYNSVDSKWDVVGFIRTV